MEINEFVELYEKEGEMGIRGCFVLCRDGRYLKDGDTMIGIATDDCEKGDIVRLAL